MKFKLNIFKKGETKLARYFAIMISLLIVVIIALMSGFYIGSAKRLNSMIKTDRDTMNSTFENIIFQTLSNSKKNDFSQIKIISNNFVQNNIISFIMIKDKKNNSILWSISNNIHQNNYISESSNDKYNIVIGFPAESAYNDYLNMLINNTQVLIIAVLLMGLIAAFLMSKIVLKPIEKLLAGANEYAQGNFSHKLDRTNFEEINGLVDSFNNMSEKLRESYRTLEQKVEDRTQKLSIAIEGLNNAYKELKETQTMMIHSEKMRSLGELVAGITHEINNPLNFIHANLIHLNNYSKNLISIINKYEGLKQILPENTLNEIDEFKKELDYEFLKTDLPSLLKSCKEGTERTKNIIIDLKNFSRMEEMVINDINIHKEIDTILNILHNKYKNKIDVIKEYEEHLPRIESYGGQLNQVFMNILDNAAYAIKDQGHVYIKTHKSDNNVIIEFKDDGEGIDPENIEKVFDPFFTTKPVGQGTGLGMSISYKVVKNHNGKIDIESAKNAGTTITVTLPIKGLRAGSGNEND